MKSIKLLISVSLLAVIFGCSGGGGSPGANGESQVQNTGTTTTTVTPETAAVADLIITLDKTQVNNNVATDVELVAQAVTSGRNAVFGAAGTVEVQDISGGAAASGGPFTTDSAGKFKAKISTGSSKVNRAVTVKVRVNGLERSTVFNILGTTLQVSVVPGAPAPGATVTVEVTAQDASNAGISNQAITLGGFTSVAGLSKPTNSQGKATFVFQAPIIAGIYNLTAEGLGATTNKTLEIVAVGGGQPPAAIGPIVAKSMSANPTVIGVNVVGANANRAQLRALFLTTGNVPVQNVRVRFDIIPATAGGATLQAGEAISTGASLVLSDNSGAAFADYISGTRSSPNNGVAVRACYDLVDFPSTACPNAVSTTFTVAAKPLSLTLGDNNELKKENNNLTYVKEFVLIVSDSAGQPVPNAQVSFSVDIYKYGKGIFGRGFGGDASVVITLVDGTTQTLSIRTNPQDNGVDDVVAGRNTWCINEDVNRNGNIDGLEDRNSNNSLEPRGADIVISSDVSGNKTDANGVLVIKVRYPQNVATWLAYSVKATALADGSEGTVVKRYRTNYVEGDQVNGSFLTAPYGFNACNQSQ
jgi:hypothetical protein